MPFVRHVDCSLFLSAAKKAPAKKSTARKSSAKKTTARKSSAKKTTSKS